jgi:hypothetical protein
LFKHFQGFFLGQELLFAKRGGWLVHTL